MRRAILGPAVCALCVLRLVKKRLVKIVLVLVSQLKRKMVTNTLLVLVKWVDFGEKINFNSLFPGPVPIKF